MGPRPRSEKAAHAAVSCPARPWGALLTALFRYLIVPFPQVYESACAANGEPSDICSIAAGFFQIENDIERAERVRQAAPTGPRAHRPRSHGPQPKSEREVTHAPRAGADALSAFALSPPAHAALRGGRAAGAGARAAQDEGALVPWPRQRRRRRRGWRGGLEAAPVRLGGGARRLCALPLPHGGKGHRRVAVSARARGGEVLLDAL